MMFYTRILCLLFQVYKCFHNLLSTDDDGWNGHRNVLIYEINILFIMLLTTIFLIKHFAHILNFRLFSQDPQRKLRSAGQHWDYPLELHESRIYWGELFIALVDLAPTSNNRLTIATSALYPTLTASIITATVPTLPAATTILPTSTQTITSTTIRPMSIQTTTTAPQYQYYNINAIIPWYQIFQTLY